MNFQKLRSLLFIPSHQEKFYSKINAINPDVVVFDLEDSVPPSLKDDARNFLFKYLSSVQCSSKEYFIRVNNPTSSFFASDIHLINQVIPNAIIVPKIFSSKCLEKVNQSLSSCINTKVFALVETALAIMNLAEICSSNKNTLAGLIFGHEDYLNDLGAYSPGDICNNLEFARANVICAAKAYGLHAIDSPYLDINDIHGLASYARKSFLSGFDGMLVLHPKQIDAANIGFTPSQDDIDNALKIVETSTSSLKQNANISYIEWSLCRTPLLKRSRSLLSKAKLLGVLNE